jgi:hypothetical protein
VLTGQAGQDLLGTYDAERRPHARALIKKAVRVGWAMTGGQDRAAAIRRIALAAAVRSKRFRQAMGSTATPRLKAGALQRVPRHRRAHMPAALRPGSLIPNPLVSADDGPPVRLDTILAGRTAVLTARQPDTELADHCRRHALVLVRITGTSTPPQLGTDPDAGWIHVRLTDDGRRAIPQALTALRSNPDLTVIVRPDGVIAAVAPRYRLPYLPWPIPAAALCGCAEMAHPLAHPAHPATP